VNNSVWQIRTLELDPRVGTKWKDSLDLHSYHTDKRKVGLWM
jgi:hypothetical protein